MQANKRTEAQTKPDREYDIEIQRARVSTKKDGQTQKHRQPRQDFRQD